jgi:tRNA(Ile)-lysidine synthase
VDAKAKQGESPEAAARIARYKVFEELIKENDILLTAHHKDDQVETFLLQLFRGSGLKGLAAMPFTKPFAKGTLIRPLLHYTREELFSYATQRKLTWIDDESNFDTNLQRNFIRHQLLPLLETHYPNVKRPLLRSQQLCQESDQLLSELAQSDFESCLTKKNDLSRLTIFPLTTFTLPRRNNVLRFWIQQNGFPLPNQKKLLELSNSLLFAKHDACPYIHWQDTEIRRYRNQLYIMSPLEDVDSKLIIPWDGKSVLKLPYSMGQLDAGIFEYYKILEPKSTVQLSIRFRQGGETIKLPNQAHHKELKKLYQDWGVPPWLRNRIPLLYYNEILTAVLLPANCH